MKKYKNLQQRMFSEINSQRLFRRAEMWGMDYLKKSFERHVYPEQKDLDELVIFNEPIPDGTGDAMEILETLHRYGSPATVAQVGGRYFGFVNGGVIPIGLAAKNLAIFWDQNTAMQVISPISSKLEVIVQKWMIDLFKLPKTTVAGFVSGTSMASFCGLAAARYSILMKQGWDVTKKGLYGSPKIRVITSTQVHSTGVKAVSLAGLGKEHIEWVGVDDQGRILVDDIPELDASSILILQAGNVNSGAFDDFDVIGKKAREQGAWIHIDGAFGLWAAATSELSYLTKGFEHADSWAVDGHKTLNTPYDSGIILCRDAQALTSSLHMTGEYIIEGDERDGMYFTPEMSKRSRVIELWATLKYLGREGIDSLIYGLHQNARLFSKLLQEVEGFSILNEVVFNQVIARCETNHITDQVIEEIQKINDCWVGGSTWKGIKVIRISICSWATTDTDIQRSVSAFERAMQRVKTRNET